MRKSKRNSAKKRLALFFGVAVMTFTGLVIGLSNLSASAESDFCEGYDYCAEIENFNGESGTIFVSASGHESDSIAFWTDENYDSDTETYIFNNSSSSSYDEETDEYNYYYFLYSNNVGLENVAEFSLYGSQYVDGEEVTSGYIAENYTAAITLDGKTLDTFSCTLEDYDPDETYDDTYVCSIPESERVAIPQRGTKFAFYRNDELPEPYQAVTLSNTLRSNRNVNTDDSTDDTSTDTTEATDSTKNTETFDGIVMNFVFLGAASIAIVGICLAGLIAHRRV